MLSGPNWNDDHTWHGMFQNRSPERSIFVDPHLQQPLVPTQLGTEWPKSLLNGGSDTVEYTGKRTTITRTSFHIGLSGGISFGGTSTSVSIGYTWERIRIDSE